MGAELGRISGPLLSANLLRNGVDLWFADTDSNTPVLYVDVNSGKIGFNSDSPTHDLLVNNTINTTNLIVDTQLDVPDFTINTNRIQNNDGPIYLQPNQLADPTIITDRLGTLNLRVSDRLIENITNNSNIELSPNGTGEVHLLTSKLDISQNLHSTGDITFDGNVTFGYDDSDNVYFLSDVASNIVPDTTDTYDLGTALKRWKTVYTHNAESTSVTASNITVNDIDLLLTQGNTWYVSVNGNDIYYGDHYHSTFRTVKKALSVAQAGDQIVIFPGTYQEEFPLVVPQGVSVNGFSLRSVNITPTAGTNTKDAFLLNGETTVENITVSGYFYDSANNTGYGFRFADDFVVKSRSPYVRNVTVITSDSVNPAGNGALVDGSVADSTSAEASMLFHAVTMIVPNAEGITVTNGSRVEWLNSFTYYANRGIHLTEGTLGFASLGDKFGAEMRSINSANVYGNYGAVADGPSTLAYLIGHNFGYIGTGTNSYNDPRLVIQANEVEELNDGKIYYDSVDHKGDYRIGSIFYVNQETGNVIFDASAINFGAEGSIIINGPNGGTIIDNSKVQTGNIRIHDNNIDSLSGPVNVHAASNKTYLNTNVFVTGNMGVTGDTKVSGDFYLGNDSSDVIIIAPELSQDINPSVTNLYTLGTTTKRWNTLYNTLLDIDSTTQITTNTISTLTTDTDLMLLPAGTGVVHVEFDNVAIDNSLTVGGILTVNGSSSLKDTEIAGNILITGNINQTGNTVVTGTFSNNNIKITGNSYFSVPDIKLFENTISSEATDADLVLSGSGTAGVILDQRLKFYNNEISNTWASATTNTQKSIIFTPNGTGNVEINSNKALGLPVGTDITRTLTQVGELRYNSNYNAFEAGYSAGKVTFNNIFDTDRNTYITPELQYGTNDNIIRFGINGVVKATISTTALSTNTLHIDDVKISGNTINNLVLTNDLEIAVTGTGEVNINDTLFSGNNITNTQSTPLVLASTGIGYVKFAGTKAIVLPTGETDERRLTPETGEVRHNTTLGYMEVYSGDPSLGDNGWIPATGTSGAATLAIVEDIMDLWSLVLG